MVARTRVFLGIAVAIAVVGIAALALVTYGGVRVPLPSGWFGDEPKDSADVAPSAQGPQEPSADPVIDIGLDDLSTLVGPVDVPASLRPAGDLTAVAWVDFFDEELTAQIAVDGLLQEGDCTIILFTYVPNEAGDAFDIPDLGIASGGNLYEGGACSTQSADDAGYEWTFDLDLQPGQSYRLYEFAQYDGASVDSADAVVLTVGDDLYEFFEARAYAG